MASFEDASRFVRVQFFLSTLGFCLLVAGLIVDVRLIGDKQLAFCVLAFLLYLVSLCLSFSWTFINEAREDKGVYISHIVFSLLAAVFTICHASRNILPNGEIAFTVSVLLFAASIVFALLTVAFTIAEVAGNVKVTLPTLPSPRKLKKEKKEKDVEAGEEEQKDEVVELEEKAEEKAEEKTEEGATNGHVVKEEEKKEEEKAEEKKEEKKEEEKEEEKKEEAATKE